MHIDWGAVVAIVLFGLGIFWANHLEARKRHRQMMKAWNQLQYDLGEYQLHKHIEDSGPLTARGIRRPSRMQVEPNAKG